MCPSGGSRLAATPGEGWVRRHGPVGAGRQEAGRPLPAALPGLQGEAPQATHPPTCQAVPPLVTELAARGARLAEQLRAVGETLGMFLNSLDKVAVEATRSHGAGREVGEALAGVVACHKEATTRLNRLTG